MNYDEVLYFLNYIYEYFPDLNERGVYEILCNFGLTNDDVEGELSSNLLHNKPTNIKNNNYFNYLISKINNSSKCTRAFCDEKWKNFCQFHNIKNKKESGQYIKVYIPLKYLHILKGSIKIFDFLEKNNIFHKSKIADVIRSDNVVVRLAEGDYDNLKLLLDFIDRDKYIKDGLNKCNPFVPTNWNKSGVGVLNIDEDISKSYNETISSCIAEYIHYQRGIDSKYYNFMKIKKENPNPEEPTVEGFYKYIEENHKFLNEDVRVQTLKLLKNSLIIGRQLDLNNKKRI